MGKNPENISSNKNGINQIIKSLSRNMTIRHKLVLMIMVACVASLVVAGSIFTGLSGSFINS